MAIKLIEASFDKSKAIKVGMQKEGKPSVTAKRVLDIIPCFEAMPMTVVTVSNDEVQTLWDEKLAGMDVVEIQKNTKLSNGQLLVN